MKTFVIDESNSKLRLDNFILEKMEPLSRSHIKHLIENGDILYNGKKVKAGQLLKVGDVVTISDILPKEIDVVAQDINIDIVYEDDNFAVINKPKGMVVHPANGNKTNTLVNALLYKLSNLSGINGVLRPGIVHRLDKDTSGLLVIAKNDASHINLAKQIQTKTCHRYYIALCDGNFKNDEGTIETGFGRHKKNRKEMAVFPLGEGKYAKTNYKVLKRYGKYTLVEFKLDTGRTHQIRVHSKYIGHPIVCDEVYGNKNSEFKVKGQLLHAYKLELFNPKDESKMTFSAPIPDDFKKVLNKLDNQN